MLAYVFLLLAVAMRVLAGTGYSSLMGLTPLGAALLFFGSHKPRKQLWIPVVLLIGADLYLTLVKYDSRITWDQPLIWAWYLGACFIGVLIRGRIKPLNVLGAALGSSVSFFVISDFAVWAAGSVGYPKTLAGLGAAYVAAIPFFKNGLVSDLVFSAAFFSMPVLIVMARRALGHAAAKDAAA